MARLRTAAVQVDDEGQSNSNHEPMLIMDVFDVDQYGRLLADVRGMRVGDHDHVCPLDVRAGMRCCRMGLHDAAPHRPRLRGTGKDEQNRGLTICIGGKTIPGADHMQKVPPRTERGEESFGCRLECSK